MNERITHDEARAIDALCSYIEENEEKHYEESDKPKDHIYRNALTVRAMLIRLEKEYEG